MCPLILGLSVSRTGAVSDQGTREGSISSQMGGTAVGSDRMKQLPELEPPEVEESETFRFVNGYRDSTIFDRKTRFPETEKISPPVLQLNEVSFGYTPEKSLLKGANIDVGLDSRIAIVGANGAGKSTLFVRGLSRS